MDLLLASELAHEVRNILFVGGQETDRDDGIMFIHAAGHNKGNIQQKQIKNLKQLH